MLDYIQQVYKGKNEFWRYLITLAVVMAPFLLNVIVFLLYPALFEQASEQMQNMQGNKNVILIENLIPFVILLVVLFLFVRFLHQRSISSLITSRTKVDWKRITFAFFFWLLISIGVIIIGVYFDAEGLVWNFKPVPFFTLLIISFLLLPLQTSLEELLFRGYLMQTLGYFAKNRWVPLIFTSALFGLMHYFNPEVEKLGAGIMVYYIGTGLLFGIVTLMDEGTEIALGMHAANNIIAATVITSNWAAFQTDALYLDTSEPSLGWDVYLPVLIIYPIVLFIFSKKYGWNNWKRRLTGKVEEPQLIA